MKFWILNDFLPDCVVLAGHAVLAARYNVYDLI